MISEQIICRRVFGIALCKLIVARSSYVQDMRRYNGAADDIFVSSGTSTGNAVTRKAWRDISK